MERFARKDFEWEVKAQEFIDENYPFKEKWVRTILGVIRGPTKNASVKTIDDAISFTEYLARTHGVSIDPAHESDVLNIPSRIEAIRRSEFKTPALYKRLSLDRVIGLFIIAEAGSCQKLANEQSGKNLQAHLDKLTKLVKFHKDITGF